MRIKNRLLFPVIVMCCIIGVSCSCKSPSPVTGGRIAFVDANGNIQVFELDTGSNYVVVDGPGNSYPSWSPDGHQLAYIRHNSEIWIYDLDIDKTNKVHRESSVIRILRWAGDGSRIYFHSGGGGPSKNFVRCIDISGSSAWCRGFELWSYPGFDVSADGNRILYKNFQNAATYGFGLAVYDVQEAIDRDAVTILPDVTEAPSWSPDGSYISFYADGKLIRVLSNGRGQTILADADPSWVELNPPTISWSPDGSQIVYEDDGYLWMIDKDGETSSQKLVRGSEPCWGP